MSKKNPAPTWHLTEIYGCSTDAYNWVLQKKSGKVWKAVGFYPTPKKMLVGLYRKLARTEPFGLVAPPPASSAPKTKRQRRKNKLT